MSSNPASCNAPCTPTSKIDLPGVLPPFEQSRNLHVQLFSFHIDTNKTRSFAPHLFVQAQIRIAHGLIVFRNEKCLFFVSVEEGLKLVSADEEVTGVAQGAVVDAVIFSLKEKNLEAL